MKKLVQVQEIEGEGLEALLGKNVAIYCINYIYAGKLIGVNSYDIILEDAGIVYDVGDHANSSTFKDFQRFQTKEWRVRTAAIESYGEMG